MSQQRGWTPLGTRSRYWKFTFEDSSIQVSYKLTARPRCDGQRLFAQKFVVDFVLGRAQQTCEGIII
jgi:hypothetical protein